MCNYISLGSDLTEKSINYDHVEHFVSYGEIHKGCSLSGGGGQPKVDTSGHRGPGLVVSAKSAHPFPLFTFVDLSICSLRAYHMLK